MTEFKALAARTGAGALRGRRHAMAMIGGAHTSIIGPIHRLAAKLGADLDCVAGVFSADQERSLASARAYGVAPDRCYASPAEMFREEARRDDGIDVVVIATPNHLHLSAALEAIAAGVHIVSDKPATASFAEARQLEAALAGTRPLYALTYTYTGFSMVREARARVAAGEIGTVRKVVATYAQGWLSRPVEKTGSASAGWRTDPARSGVGGSSADVGVHAFNLIEYVSGRQVTELLADARPLVAGRSLDDDCNALLRLDNGGAGVLVCSQIAWGERNTVSVSVYGDAGAVHWSFDRADELRIVRSDESVELLLSTSPGLKVRSTLPRGLGTGVVLPLAAIYRDVVAAIDGDFGLIGDVVPGIREGVRGLAFVDAVTQGGDGGWVRLE